MKKERVISLVLIVVLIASMFAGCGEVTDGPVEAKLKTDLNDAVFTFTYGELRAVLPSDQLAALFETTNKKTDDKTVKITYAELASRFSDKDYFGDVLALLSADDLKALTGNQAEVLDYFNKLINGIKKYDTAEVKFDEEFKIHFGDDILFRDKNGNELPEQDKFRAAFRIYCDASLKNIDSYLLNSGDESKKPSEFLYLLGSDTASLLTLDDLYGENGTYPVYSSVIPTYSYALDENGENAKDESGEFIFVPTELLRKIVITVKPQENSVKKAFTVREKDGIMKELKKADKYMTVNSYDIGFSPCVITASVNGINDRMTSVVYEKNMAITADVTFTGALEKYGNVTVEFPCTSTLTYEFGWS